MKLEKGQRVKLTNEDSGGIYKIEKFHKDVGFLPEEQQVSIQSTLQDGATRTVKRKDLRLLNDVEKKEYADLQRSLRPPPAARVHPKRASRTPARNIVTDNEEVKSSDIAFPVSSSAAEFINVETKFLLAEITRITDTAIVKRDSELKEIPNLCGIIKRLIDSLANKAGKPRDFPEHDLDSVNGARNLLATLEKDVDSTFTDLALKNADLNEIVVNQGKCIEDIVADRKKLKSQVDQLKNSLESATVDAKQTKANLEKEKLRGQDEKEKLSKDIILANERAEKAEREKQEEQIEKQRAQEKVVSALFAFWRLRKEFYDGLHRAISDLKDKNPERFRNDIESRNESLKTDIVLLEELGCEIIFKSESLVFGHYEYDGAVHEPFSRDGSIDYGEIATILLPGWTFGANAKADPILGRLEINQ